jgi:hypothetical protein
MKKRERERIIYLLWCCGKVREIRRVWSAVAGAIQFVNEVFTNASADDDRVALESILWDAFLWD